MIINTRNFFLYLLSLAFLLIAISTTAIYQEQSESNLAAVGYSEASEIKKYGVEVSIPNSLDRSVKVKEMRDKVLASGVVLHNPPQVEVVPVIVLTDTGSTEAALLLCADYLEDKRLWQPGQVEFVVVEGARILVSSQSESLDSGSSSLPVVPLLQLPVQSFPLAEPSCLPSDVVAVALDGSLIRNNELALYGIFTQETLLGYALDGFPLYGAATGVSLDACGGVTLPGGYRYHLDQERAVVLNCFASSPVSL